MALEPDGEERLLDFPLDGALGRQKQVLGELLGDRRAALGIAVPLGVGNHCPQSTPQIDAEVVVEPAVFGGERGFDQIVGQFVDWIGIVGPNAATADFGAELVEKDHRQVFGLVELAGGGGIERRQREPYRQHGANRQKGQRVRDDFDEKPL